MNRYEKIFMEGYNQGVADKKFDEWYCDRVIEQKKKLLDALIGLCREIDKAGFVTSDWVTAEPTELIEEVTGRKWIEIREEQRWTI